MSWRTLDAHAHCVLTLLNDGFLFVIILGAKLAKGYAQNDIGS